ncbi:hypothetical protein ACFQ1E_12035 [Sphingomonas canadensis]|uniref:Uncharacterized protein n=1 Tax=Sphingomonas canadensis TaxID=1219257 RepID=A0ABW3H9F3_9SPHN|nr:hypothetical protein [Sphingomonas canadensis]MCW3836796.1 hypothetical protein [Sphingomonas canadensis]
MRVSAFAIVVGTLWSSAASAQCASYVGQTVAPVLFEQVIASFGNIAPKGEFETTAAYQARVAAAGGGGPLIISKKPEDPKYFAYDADNQVLRVQSYAFHNTNIGWWEAFYEAKPAGITASTMSNIAIVISQTEKANGTYRAQNSYGASTDVVKIDRTTYSIFEREAPPGQYNVFDAEKDGNLGSIPMDIATAQRTKPTLRIAFVVVPKAPYLVEGTHSVGRVTVSNPRDVTEHFKIMIADLQCGLLMDSVNKVLAAYPTR